MQADDRRRKLRGHSRFDETPAEVVIELSDAGYRLVGSTGDANRADRQQVIAEILSDGVLRTPDEIREQLAGRFQTRQANGSTGPEQRLRRRAMAASTVKGPRATPTDTDSIRARSHP